MAIPALLAGTGKLAMQVLPFLPGIASVAQGNYGQGAAQAAHCLWHRKKIPGVGKLAGGTPMQQAAALGLQNPRRRQSVATLLLTLLALALTRSAVLLGMGESGALQRGKSGFLGGDAVYSSPAMQQMAQDAVMATRLGNEEQLRAMEAQYGITQKYAQANQQRYQQKTWAQTSQPPRPAGSPSRCHQPG